MLTAFRNPSFLALFFGFSLYAVSAGVNQTLNAHLNVFFWQFDTRQISWLVASYLVGFFPGVALARPLHARFDKKRTMIASATAAAVLTNVAVLLRVVGLFPSNGTSALFWVVFGLLVALALISGIALTTAGSMMADVAQEHEFQTGKPQQGVLFSAISLSGKAASGLGHLVAGIGIDMIAFPLKAEPSAVAADMVFHLGLLNLLSSVIGVIGLSGYLFYRIDHHRHQETQAAIASRAGVATPASTAQPGAQNAQTARGVA
jgi:Na+/melibiose symporter-like transporter